MVDVSLAVLPGNGGSLRMAWKGVAGDQGIYFATLNDFSGAWIDQEHVPGIGGAAAPGTSVGPCIAVFNDQLYMVWKGVQGDQSMWWTTYTDQNGWGPQQPVVGSDGVVPGTSVGPQLAVFNGRLYMAWKGVQGDQSIWWSSTSDGREWRPQQQVRGSNGVVPGTSVGPSLAVYGEQLYMAWKGVQGDPTMWWSSTSDGQNWASQNQINLGFGFSTSVGPSLAVLNNELYMAWKGVEGDQGIWWSSTPGVPNWGAQQQVCGVGTSVGPCLAAYNDTLYMAWKGVDGDDGIYWTLFGLNPGGQVNVPGADTDPGELAV